MVRASVKEMRPVHALVAGWFSFPWMGATAGDLMVRDLVSSWLTRAGIGHDIASLPGLGPGVDWRDVDSGAYTDVIFVCGPVGNGPPLAEFLNKFSAARLAAVDVTVLDPLSTWNPFDLLIERDSDRVTRPDLAFLSCTEETSVVGIVLMHAQPAHGLRDGHLAANAALELAASQLPFARVAIDTRLDDGENRLRTPAEVITMIARCDVVMTSRLHGLVLSLRAGVPAVAVDPVIGGGKVTRQAATLDWPYCFSTDADPRAIAAAVRECLLPRGRELAAAAATRARYVLTGVEEEIVSYLGSS